MILPFLEWTATGLSVLGLYLIAKKRMFWGYLAWIIGAPMWVILGMMTHAYGTAVTFSIFLVMDFFGLYEWEFKKERKK